MQNIYYDKTKSFSECVLNAHSYESFTSSIQSVQRNKYHHTLKIYIPFYAIYDCISLFCEVCMMEYLNEKETFLQRFGGDNGDGYTTIQYTCSCMRANSKSTSFILLFSNCVIS